MGWVILAGLGTGSLTGFYELNSDRIPVWRRRAANYIRNHVGE